MSDIVERLDEIIAKNVALEIDGMSEAIKAHYRAAFCTEAASEITRLQAELSSAKEAHLSILKEERAYARAEALEDTLREVVLCPVGTQEGWQGKLDMRNEIAAAIRRLKGATKPKPVPSLGKLFDDLAAKQRLIGEEFEKFMTDVEDTTEADDEGAIRKLKEKP